LIWYHVTEDCFAPRHRLQAGDVIASSEFLPGEVDPFVRAGFIEPIIEDDDPAYGTPTLIRDTWIEVEHFSVPEMLGDVEIVS
jgi:hypothetical protein